MTVQEKHPEGLKARTKTVVRYVDDLSQRRWHDGSPQTLADFLLSAIMMFERPAKDSAIFDAAAVPAFQTFVQYFRGVKIVQDNPLVVEFYSDQPNPDAEWLAANAAGFVYSTTPWHALALGILAESNGRLAFSADKAEKLKIERMSYIAGPSLPILEDYLKQAQAEGYIPYEKALGKYVTKEQASSATRPSGSGTTSTSISGLATARISSSRSTRWKRRWSCGGSTNSARWIRGG